MTTWTAVPRVHDTSTGPSRRQVLRAVGTGAGSVAAAGVLAACGEQAPGAEESAGEVASAGAGTVVIAVAEVPVGGAASATVNDQPVLVTQPVAGEVHAFSAICTHQGCTVGPGEGELLCPCHQSRFALEDAAVLGGPAPGPLATIAVTVQGDDVVLA